MKSFLDKKTANWATKDSTANLFWNFLECFNAALLRDNYIPVLHSLIVNHASKSVLQIINFKDYHRYCQCASPR